jgi:dTDP-D-glucose 4,6-dehydratase
LVQAIQVVFTTIRPEIPLLKPLHKPARLGDIQRSAASIQRIQNDTQWSPSIAFQDGLREQILDRLNTK